MTDFASLGATCCLAAAVATTLSLKRVSTAATHLLTAIAAVLALRGFSTPMRLDYHDCWLLLSATLTGVAVGAAVASHLKRRKDSARVNVSNAGLGHRRLSPGQRENANVPPGGVTTGMSHPLRA